MTLCCEVHEHDVEGHRLISCSSRFSFHAQGKDRLNALWQQLQRAGAQHAKARQPERLLPPNALVCFVSLDLKAALV